MRYTVIYNNNLLAHRITSINYHRGPSTAAVTACLCITSRALHTIRTYISFIIFLQIPYLLYITRPKSDTGNGLGGIDAIRYF